MKYVLAELLRKVLTVLQTLGPSKCLGWNPASIRANGKTPRHFYRTRIFLSLASCNTLLWLWANYTNPASPWRLCATNHCSQRYCGGIAKVPCTEKGKHYQTVQSNEQATVGTHRDGSIPLIKISGSQFHAGLISCSVKFWYKLSALWIPHTEGWSKLWCRNTRSLSSLFWQFWKLYWDDP